MGWGGGDRERASLRCKVIVASCGRKGLPWVLLLERLAVLLIHIIILGGGNEKCAKVKECSCHMVGESRVNFLRLRFLETMLEKMV